MLIYIFIIITISIIFSINKIEGYDSYTTCIDQGYPHKFCLHSPIIASYTEKQQSLCTRVGYTCV